VVQATQLAVYPYLLQIRLPGQYLFPYVPVHRAKIRFYTPVSVWRAIEFVRKPIVPARLDFGDSHQMTGMSIIVPVCYSYTAQNSLCASALLSVLVRPCSTSCCSADGRRGGVSPSSSQLSETGGGGAVRSISLLVTL